MTELELHKFVEESASGWNWWTDDVCLFVNVCDINEFMELIGYTFLTNNEFRVVMRGSYFAVNMCEICEYFNIEVENVFPKKENIFNKP